MQSSVLLSVIVPFYKVSATHLGQLLCSIDEQLTDQVQVILIADGPTDGSVELAQHHIAAAVAPECYVLQWQPNAGVSVARNNGIARAKGDYIGFIDADDLLLPGYISALLDVIQQHQPDLIEIGYKRFKDSDALNAAKPRYLHSRSGWLQKQQAVTDVFKVNQWFSFLRVYRKKLATDFQFPPGIAFCEDVMAIPALYEAAEKLYHLRLPLYGYREHHASASFHVKTEHQQQLHCFFTSLQQHQSYPNLLSVWRHILLFHLAYLLYKLQLDNKNLQHFPDQLHQQFKALLRNYWWLPHFSVRKKLMLAFAPYFFSKRQDEQLKA